MTLGDFIKNYVELDTIVNIEARYPAEDTGLWFEYSGPISILFDENGYEDLLNSRLESVRPVLHKRQIGEVRLGIIVVRD